jgi:hypothetical protein
MRKSGAVRGETGGNEGMKVLPRPLLRGSEPIPGTRRAHLPGDHFPSNRCQSSSEVKVPPLSEQLPVSELLAEGEPTVLDAEDVELLVVYELRASLVDEVCHDVAQVFGPEAPSSVGEVLNGFVVVVVHGSWREQGTRFSDASYRCNAFWRGQKYGECALGGQFFGHRPGAVASWSRPGPSKRSGGQPASWSGLGPADG